VVSGLGTFFIIWAGQLASILGSEMTSFAVTIWAWETTGQATPLSLILFFTRMTKVITAIFGGIVVDRFSRKRIMIFSDSAIALFTILLLLLLWAGNLQIWHFYLGALVSGIFGYIQGLAYTTTIPLIVPKQHYARANALSYGVSAYGPGIIAPALAGGLYPLVGLTGILLIDLATFALAVLSVALIHLPEAPPVETPSEESPWDKLSFGFRYIFARPSLLAILIFLLSGNLFGSVTVAISSPMILARSGNDEAVLATVLSASGVGGLLGALILSVWGGPKPRIHGLFWGVALKNLSQMLMGLLKTPPLWVITSFFRSFFSPLVGTANTTIWISKVAPGLQGRVFASRFLIAQIASPIGLAIAGPLADYVFEPAMQPNGILAGIFGSVFGTGEGSGMALQFTLVSILGSAIGLGGYFFPILRDVEKIVPDRKVSSE
jgi:predicted MFS family arabinose efflux permease